MENIRKENASVSHFELTALEKKELMRRREHESFTRIDHTFNMTKGESVKEIDMQQGRGGTANSAGRSSFHSFLSQYRCNRKQNPSFGSSNILNSVKGETPDVPGSSKKKRKHEESNTKLAVPDTSAYNMLFAVNAYLDDLCKVQSALNSLAKEFEKTLETKEKGHKEKKVPYDTFFDNLEYAYKFLKEKKRRL
ncbi:hypothetical protein GCK72_026185 [Caenorhabditis remanei]|uniref:Uncharacterized protein n=1 Tax=Caenorhabditis remanei TaxID=31234 RepID=A0A6A5G445_CAERE|nr:hypothetical protein GCK72_026185 [Caenorhabditis remanei]KAF1749717.1 hypothetical protein GCK72_026185 [Caenorhabditis remanei]